MSKPFCVELYPECKENENRWLYHYTSLDAALKILISKRLRMSPLGKVNDPYESNLLAGHMSFSSKKGVNFTPDNDRKYLNLIREAYQIKPKVLCFSQDDKRLKFNHPSYSGYKRTGMWAHYGDNHAGVCLAFNQNKLLSSMNLFPVSFNGLVEYERAPCLSKASSGHDGPFVFDESKVIEDIDSYLLEKMINHYHFYFFTKTESWIQEGEYRLVTLTNQASYEYLYSHDALEGIVVGGKCDNDEVQSLFNPLIELLNVPLFKIWFSRSGCSTLALNKAAVSVSKYRQNNN